MSRSNQDNNNMHFFTYDARGRILPEGTENGDAVTYHYDAAGHRINTDLPSTQNNELNQPSDNWHNGVTHTVEYDAENRIIYGSAATESGNDEGMRFVRDAMGNRIHEGRAIGDNIMHSYDAPSRRISTNQAMENSVTVTTYYYGPDGQVTETTTQIPRREYENSRITAQPNRNRLFTIPSSIITLTDEERSAMDAIP